MSDWTISNPTAEQKETRKELESAFFGAMRQMSPSTAQVLIDSLKEMKNEYVNKNKDVQAKADNLKNAKDNYYNNKSEIQSLAREFMTITKGRAPWDYEDLAEKYGLEVATSVDEEGVYSGVPYFNGDGAPKSDFKRLLDSFMDGVKKVAKEPISDKKALDAQKKLIDMQSFMKDVKSDLAYKDARKKLYDIPVPKLAISSNPELKAMLEGVPIERYNVKLLGKIKADPIKMNRILGDVMKEIK